MKPRAWQRGVIKRSSSSPLIWGIQYSNVYRWDERVGFKLRFGFGRLVAEYTSKDAR